MTMLSKMIRDGYLRLNYTNNLAAKYAYSLSDAEMMTMIELLPDMTIRDRLSQQFQVDALLFRAKMAIFRFFPKESNDYILLSLALFKDRLGQPQT